MSASVPIPPLIPGSAVLQTLEVSTAKIDSIVGNALSTLNSWKGSVTVASTANLTLSGLQTIDGVLLVDNDTILVKNQATGSENGIYAVHAGVWTRNSNMITGSNAAGVAVFANEGTTNADTIWVCTNDEATAVVGTDALVFASITTVIGAAGSDTQVQFNNAGALAGDAGLTFTVGSGTLQATILTDGTLSSTAGTVTGGVAATFSGAVTGGTVTDGTLTTTAGALTGATSLTSTDVSFGTAATDLHGFYGTAAIARPAVSTANTAFVANTSGIVSGDATYLGYTVEGIVTNLQALGLLS